MRGPPHLAGQRGQFEGANDGMKACQLRLLDGAPQTGGCSGTAISYCGGGESRSGCWRLWFLRGGGLLPSRCVLGLLSPLPVGVPLPSRGPNLMASGSPSHLPKTPCKHHRTGAQGPPLLGVAGTEALGVQTAAGARARPPGSECTHPASGTPGVCVFGYWFCSGKQNKTKTNNQPNKRAC